MGLNLTYEEMKLFSFQMLRLQLRLVEHLGLSAVHFRILLGL